MARVLLVEPNDHLRRVFRRRFTREGFELVEATDGEGALGVARSGHPDLIVLEGSVRDGAGRELPLRLATDPELRDVPLIVLGVREEGAPEGDVGPAPAAGAGAPDGSGVRGGPPPGAPHGYGGAGGGPQELRHPFRPGKLVELARGVLQAGAPMRDGAP